MKTKWIKVVFGFSALYDGLLAVTFLFFNAAIFDFFGIPQRSSTTFHRERLPAPLHRTSLHTLLH